MPRSDFDTEPLPRTTSFAPFDVTDGLLDCLRTMATANRLVLGHEDLPDVLGGLPSSTIAALFAQYGRPRSILAGRRRLYRRTDLDEWIKGLPADATLRGRSRTDEAA